MHLRGFLNPAVTHGRREPTNVAGSRTRPKIPKLLQDGPACYSLHSESGLLSGVGVGYNRAVGKSQDFGRSHSSLNLFSICSTISSFMFLSNLGPDVSSKLSEWELKRLLPLYREICWSNWGSK